MKIGVLAGQPTDGTVFPKEEKYVWKELIRVMKQDLSIVDERFEFIIPIFNKFDIEVLRIIEQLNAGRMSDGLPEIKTTYYLPTITWGTRALPQHQLDLIRRMRTQSEQRIVSGGNMSRINQMIKDADVMYILGESAGMDSFSSQLKNKICWNVSTKNMRYQTEEDAKAFHSKHEQNITKSQVEEWLLKMKG